MLTDTPPRKTSSARFLQSDRMRTLDLPQDRTLLAIAKSIESGMKAGSSADVRRSCAEFLDFAAAFYEVPSCGFRVLAARPLRVRENWASELFGDYHPETMLIRIWMRTAVRREITSFGTFLSTLCHEFCGRGRRDAGPDRVAGAVRARPPSCGAERPRARRGRRSRFDGGTART